MRTLTREEIAGIVVDVTDEEARAMHRAAQRILAWWGIDPLRQIALIGSPYSEVGLRSDEEKLALICIVNIHAQLRLIFGVSDRAYTWTRALNTAFSGVSAVELIECEGVAGLVLVFAYLAKVLGDEVDCSS